MFKNVSYLLVLALLLTTSVAAQGDSPERAVLDAQAQRVATMAKVARTVVAVFDAGGQGGGSGVLISPDGFALTNFHVVQPCGYAMKCGLNDGKIYDAVLVGVDPGGDVAMIKLFPQKETPNQPFPYAPLGDSDKLEVGDPCFAMGNPFLFADDFKPTITTGIVSGVRRYQEPIAKGTLLEYTDCIQVDAAINGGNSGGPLFNYDGEVIGINGRGQFAFQKRGKVHVGFGFAISINQIKNFLGSLHSGRIVDHARAGMLTNFGENGSVLVAQMNEEQDAFRRGLRMGNELITLAGRPVPTPNAYKNIIGIYPKGWRIPVTYRDADGVVNSAIIRLLGRHRNDDELFSLLAPGEQENIKIEIPERKEGEKKPEESEEEKKQRKEMEKIKAKIEEARRKREALIPEIVKKHYVEKRGFANFYYNKLHRDRLLTGWQKDCSLATTKGAWKLTGKRADNGAPFEINIDDQGGSLSLAGGAPYTWKAEDPKNKLTPQGSGLLLALYEWRKLATKKPAQFGEVVYYGDAPLRGDRKEMVEVIEGISTLARTRFYLDKKRGNLLGLETFAEESGIDPCEIYFSDYRAKDGKLIPGTIAVVVGDVPFVTFELK